MTFTRYNKRVVIWLLAGLLIFCSLLLMGAKASREAKTLTLRNAADSLMPLVELSTESGSCYVKAKAFHLEMLLNYVDHMESRHIPFLLRLPPFSKKNIVKILKSVAKDLENADQTNSREAIEKAANKISEFLSKSKPFMSEPIIIFELEVMSKKMRDEIDECFENAHIETQRYAANESRSVDDAMAACMANRRAIVYLYLARFGYQEFVSQKELKKFRSDINRTIYYNRLLQQTDAVKGGEGLKYSDYWRLDRYSDSERRRLRLLQAIIDDDIQKAQTLLQIAVIKAIPDIQFLAVTR